MKDGASANFRLMLCRLLQIRRQQAEKANAIKERAKEIASATKQAA